MTLLTLENAEHALAAAKQAATERNVALCIAVCDAGGRLMAFARMDGCNWASIYGAQGKALCAAATGVASGKIPPEQPVMRRIAELEGNNMIFGQGAVPITIDGILVGAIGAGGASGDIDEAVAQAGADAIVNQSTRG